MTTQHIACVHLYALKPDSFVLKCSFVNIETTKEKIYKGFILSSQICLV